MTARGGKQASKGRQASKQGSKKASTQASMGNNGKSTRFQIHSWTQQWKLYPAVLVGDHTILGAMQGCNDGAQAMKMPQVPTQIFKEPTSYKFMNGGAYTSRYTLNHLILDVLQYIERAQQNIDLAQTSCHKCDVVFREPEFWCSFLRNRYPTIWAWLFLGQVDGNRCPSCVAGV